MEYVVVPGLYAVGNPSPSSEVFVTANYKMSFDRLRSELNGIDGWILVLDTKGINVWCAAGKGTFGTDEVVHRVSAVGLGEVVSHRRLVLPQLGAPGVAAHEVKARTGFRVVYGPVLAAEIPAFLSLGMKATPEMRSVSFRLVDRAVLAPTELVGSSRYALLAMVALLILSGFGRDVYSVERVFTFGAANVLVMLGLWIAASLLPPVLLPWLPGRSFTVKGAWLGLVLAVVLAGATFLVPEVFPSLLTVAGWMLMIMTVTSFQATNFTGASTYTSLSGVLKEMRIGVPMQMGTAVAGLGLWIAGLFV
jgi:hypothetical protein